MGDINSIIGRKSNYEIVGRFGKGECKDNRERLIDIYEQNQLRIWNGFFEHKDIHRCTWEQHIHCDKNR